MHIKDFVVGSYFNHKAYGFAMLTLDITQPEFDEAKRLFRSLPSSQSKLSYKKHDGLNHSFIRVDDEVYGIEKGNARSLGHGSFGRVKRCISQDGQIYAVKVVGSDEDGSTQDIESISNEVDVLRSLSRLVGSTKQVNQKKYLSRDISHKYYIVEKYLPGQTLAEKLMEPLTLNEKLTIARSVCVAIGHLHRKSILHGDVKPENFIIDEENLASSIDFGLSLIHTGDPYWKLPPDGTRTYIAPERLSHEDTYQFTSDIYSLAKMLLNDFRFTYGWLHTIIDAPPAERPTVLDVHLKLIAEADNIPQRITYSNYSTSPYLPYYLDAEQPSVAAPYTPAPYRNRYPRARHRYPSDSSESSESYDSTDNTSGTDAERVSNSREAAHNQRRRRYGIGLPKPIKKLGKALNKLRMG